MRTQRKLRRLTIDVTKFLADYNDAVALQMPVREFLQVTGLSIGGLHGRLRTLAKRGVILPMLVGMKKKTQMGRLLGVCPAVEPAKQEAPVTPSNEIDYDRLAKAVLRQLTAAS